MRPVDVSVQKEIRKHGPADVILFGRRVCEDEAVRQVISVGGSLDELAILDNFCWGNPDKPDRLGGLVRAATPAAHEPQRPITDHRHPANLQWLGEDRR
jgi:hypothetical protein